MITIELPRALAAHVNGRTRLVVEEPCATVGDALTAIAQESPGVVDRVLDEQGQVRPHVNVFVNEKSIRFLHGLQTPTPEGTTVLIIAAVSGG